MKTGNFEWTDESHTEVRFVECGDTDPNKELQDITNWITNEYYPD
jgi:hypothetical protein